MAWLRAYLMLTPMLLFVPSLSQAKALAKLDGSWRFEYSCSQATGMYKDRCDKGERDYFTIDVATYGVRVCETYEQTYQMGNHVNDGDFSGHIRAGIAHVIANPDGDGKATMTWTAEKLHWHNLDAKPQFNMLPPDAVLTRQIPRPNYEPPTCAGG